jgi:formyl-CoA transferase
VDPERLAPRLGENGVEILRQAGFSAEEIAAMIRDGVTRVAPDTVKG